MAPAITLLLGLLAMMTGPVTALDGLYISNATDILFSRDLSSYTSVYKQVYGRIVGMTHDYSGSYLFWSDIEFTSRGIYRASVNTDGTLYNVMHIVDTDIIEVNSMCVDHVNNRIYWTDEQKRTIEVADYQGDNRLMLNLRGLDRPRGIAVDTKNQFLYWGDQGSKVIKRSRPDGSDVVDYVSDSVDLPNQMTILNDGTLVWVDAFRNYLNKKPMSGSVVGEPLIPTRRDDTVFGIAVNGATTYVSVWSDRGEILANGMTSLLVDLGTDFIFSLVYYTSQQSPESSPCSSATCADICLPVTQMTKRCACPSTGGKVLRGTSCVDPGEVMLYAVADEGVVAFYDLAVDADNTYRHVVGSSLRPVAVAYDPQDKVVYWSDVLERTIHKAKLDGTEHRIFLSYEHSLGIVDGLAVDAKSRRLFYTNWGSIEEDGASYSWHTIESVSLDNANNRQIVTSDLEKPRGLAISDNYLYATDWGSRSRVIRCELDGSNPEVIAAGLDNPNGVAVKGNMVFVVDSHYKTRKPENRDYEVERKNGALYIFENNNGIWVSKSIYLTQEIPYSVDLTSDGTIYISEWEENAVLRAHYNGSTLTKPEPIISADKPMGLLLIDIRTTTTSSCNGACVSSEVCLVNPAGQTECQCDSYKPRTSSNCMFPDQFLLFADVTNINMVDLDTEDRTVYTLVQGDGHFSNYVGLTYDSASKTIFFSDTERKTIFKYTLTTMNKTEFFAPDALIDGMTIIQGRLYWSNYQNGTLESIALDGTEPTPRVVMRNLDSPRAVCTDGSDLFWTEWGQNPGVFKTRITNGNGGRNEKLVDDLVWPNGCRVSDGFLYVGDGKEARIHKCNINGQVSCQTIPDVSAHAQHIYDVEVSGSIVVWSDWNRGTISFGLTGRDNQGSILGDIAENLIRPTQIHLIYSPPSVCIGCQSHCESIFGRTACGCGTGQYLAADGVTCSNSSVSWVRADASSCSDTCSTNTVCGRLVGSDTFQCVCNTSFSGPTCTACSSGTSKTFIGPETCIRTDTCNGGFWDLLSKSCKTSSESKSGVCPTSALVSGDCSSDCASDNGCQDAAKCCSLAKCSGSVCRDPTATPECVFEGVPYNVGDVFRPDSCTRCVCTVDHSGGDPRFGGALCQVTDCPDLNCSLSNLETVPGACCPQCGPSTPEKCLRITNCPVDTLVLNVQESGDSGAFDNFLPEWEFTCVGSGNNVRLTRDPDSSEHPWLAGNPDQQVTYTVMRNGNDGVTDTCVYNVMVTDNTPVVIICPDDQTYLTDQDELVVQPIQPKNVDEVEGYTSDVDFRQPLAVGTHTVRYTIARAGRSDTCTFRVTIEKTAGGACGVPPAITNGQYDCDEEFTQCNLRCNDGFSTASVNQRQLACTGGSWSLRNLNRNLCSKLVPNIVKASLSMRLNVCKPNMDLDFTRSSARGLAMKRVKPPIKFKVDVSGCKKQRRRPKRQADEDELLIVDIELTAEYSTTEEGEEIKMDMSDTLNGIRDDILNGLLKTQSEEGIQTVETNEDDISINPPEFSCPVGTIILTESDCLTCTSGTYQQDDQCAVCEVNTYQDTPGSTECLPCPQDTKSDVGAYEAELCAAQTSSSNVAIIAGVCAAVGVVIIIAIIIAIVVIYKRKSKHSDYNKEVTMNNPAFDHNEVYDEIDDVSRPSGGADEASGYTPMTFKPIGKEGEYEKIKA